MKKQDKIQSYKGFDKDLKCRGYQYKIGDSYKHNGEIKVCNSGFHACEYPLDVFNYYGPANSRYAIVEQFGDISKENNSDSKIASSDIILKSEINIHGIIQAAIDFTMSKISDSKKTENKKDKNLASNSGDYGAASNSGYGGAASNSGYGGAASNSGALGAANNSGYGGAASTEGKNSIAIAIAPQCKAKASSGEWIVLAYRDDDWNIKHVKAAQAGITKGVKADTWYKLSENGKFEEQK